MSGLILGLLLAQTYPLRISIQVTRPTCVVIDAAGQSRVVARNALQAGEQPAVCGRAPGAASPRVEQHVEVAATPTTPEQRLVEIFY